MCGFKIGRSEKSRKLTIISDIVDGSMLEIEIAQGKIVLLPKRDFPDDLPILQTNQSIIDRRPSTTISRQAAATRTTVSLRPRVLTMSGEVSDQEEDSDNDLGM